MLIDSHCHLDYPGIFDNLESVINRSKENGICSFVTIGCSENSWDNTINICSKNEKIYGALGIHPHDSLFFDKYFKKKLVKNILSCEKIKAIGEIGLDYHYLDKNLSIEMQKKLQKDLFVSQLDLASELNLPVIIHTREAENDTLDILSKYNHLKILIHCFSGSEYFGERIIANGYFISFSGIITFDKSGVLNKVLKKVPLNKLLIETDSPYLSPIPFRGKSNNPSNLIYIFKDISKTRKIEENILEESIEKNTKLFFNIC